MNLDEDIDYQRKCIEAGLGVQLVMPLLDISLAIEEWKVAPGGRDYAPSIRAITRIVKAFDNLDKAALFRALLWHKPDAVKEEIMSDLRNEEVHHVKYEETNYGFIYGPLKITRLHHYPKDVEVPTVVIELKTQRKRVQIHVTPTGLIRIGKLESLGKQIQNED